MRNDGPVCDFRSLRDRKLCGCWCERMHPLLSRMVSKLYNSERMRHVLAWDLLFRGLKHLLQLRGRNLRAQLGHIRVHLMRSWNILVVDGGKHVRYLPSGDLSIKHRLNKLHKLPNGIVLKFNRLLDVRELHKLPRR